MEGIISYTLSSYYLESLLLHRRARSISGVSRTCGTIEYFRIHMIGHVWCQLQSGRGGLHSESFLGERVEANLQLIITARTIYNAHSSGLNFPSLVPFQSADGSNFCLNLSGG